MDIAIAFIVHRSLLRCSSKPIVLFIEAYCVFSYDKRVPSAVS